MSGIFMLLAAARSTGGDGGSSGGGGPVLTFVPVAGNYQEIENAAGGGAEFTIVASEAVVWNYSISGLGQASVPNGTSATSITFTLTAGLETKTSTISVSAGGSLWGITLTAFGTGGIDEGGGGGTGGNTGGGTSSPAIFSPTSGSYEIIANRADGSAEFIIVSSIPVVWHYAITGQAQATTPSGSSAGYITFTLPAVANTRNASISLSADGQTWSINLTALGNGSSTGGGSASTAFAPTAGNYQVTDNRSDGGATFTIEATAPVVWSYAISGLATATVANGASASSITFNLNNGLSDRTSNISVSAGGQQWGLTLTSTGSQYVAPPGDGGGTGGGINNNQP